MWAHVIPHGQAEYSSQSDYDALYPLDYFIGNHTTPRREGSGVSRAQQAGVTGVQVLQFDWVNDGDDFVEGWMAEADPTWTDGDPHNDFRVAPCMYIKNGKNALLMASSYVNAARRHRSAAMVDGKYVVFVYHPRSLSPTEWHEARLAIEAADLPVFLIGDLQTDSSQHGNRVDASLLDPYLPYFDATWVFEDQMSLIWGQVLGYVRSRGLPFAGGIMPGYDRDTPGGGFVDAKGTSLFRGLWQASLESGASWVTINTWNDTVERTDVRGSSDWNLTRQDISAFYSARLRGLKPPRASAELYVTTQDSVKVGQPISAEGLILNGSSVPATVFLKMVDESGRALSDTQSATAFPGETAHVTAPTDLRLDGVASGGFVRARVWSQDADGRVLQSALSAPILVYSEFDELPHGKRIRYYSYPARNYSPGHLEKREQGIRRGTVLRLSSERSARFLELLVDTKQVALEVDSTSVSVPESLPAGTTLVVARIIDSAERVSYSVLKLGRDPR